MKGAPLRFAGVVIGGWMLGRSFALWPVDLPAPTPALAAVRAARAPVAITPLVVSDTLPGATVSDDGSERPSRTRPTLVMSTRLDRGVGAMPIGSAAADPEIVDRPDQGGDASDTVEAAFEQTLEAKATVASPAGSAARLHGDAWLVARTGGGDTLAFGQLGASQAGVRLTYALDGGRHVALSARVSTPFEGAGREAAAGVDWRPLPLPVHLLLEARAPLDGGPLAPAAQLIGGGAVRLPLRLQVEGYAQAGAVRRRGAFADGSARLTHQLLRFSRARVDLGAGAWAAAQRRLARIDLGPTLGVAVPVGRAAVRLGADYRFRVAGRARPGSGPAVTLGSSF